MALVWNQDVALFLVSLTLVSLPLVQTQCKCADTVKKSCSLNGTWFDQMGWEAVITEEIPRANSYALGGVIKMSRKDSIFPLGAQGTIFGARAYKKDSTFGMIGAMAGGAVIAWVGQCYVVEGSERLITRWLLRRPYIEEEYTIRSTQTGSDIFYRDQDHYFTRNTESVIGEKSNSDYVSLKNSEQLSDVDIFRLLELNRQQWWRNIVDKVDRTSRTTSENVANDNSYRTYRTDTYNEDIGKTRTTEDNSRTYEENKQRNLDKERVDKDNAVVNVVVDENGRRVEKVKENWKEQHSENVRDKDHFRTKDTTVKETNKETQWDNKDSTSVKRQDKIREKWDVEQTENVDDSTHYQTQEKKTKVTTDDAHIVKVDNQNNLEKQHLTSVEKLEKVDRVAVEEDKRVEKHENTVSKHQVVKSEDTGDTSENWETTKVSHITKTANSEDSLRTDRSNIQSKHTTGREAVDHKSTETTRTVNRETSSDTRNRQEGQDTKHVKTQEKTKDVETIKREGNDKIEKHESTSSKTEVVESEDTGVNSKFSKTARSGYIVQSTSNDETQLKDERTSENQRQHVVSNHETTRDKETKSVNQERTSDTKHRTDNEKGHVTTHEQTKNIDTVKFSGNEKTEKHEKTNSKHQVVESDTRGVVKDTSKTSTTVETTRSTSNDKRHTENDRSTQNERKQTETDQMAVHRTETTKTVNQESIDTRKDSTKHHNTEHVTTQEKTSNVDTVTSKGSDRVEKHEKTNSKNEVVKSDDTGTIKETSKTSKTIETTKSNTENDENYFKDRTNSQTKHLKNENERTTAEDTFKSKDSGNTEVHSKTSKAVHTTKIIGGQTTQTDEKTTKTEHVSDESGKKTVRQNEMQTSVTGDKTSKTQSTQNTGSGVTNNKQGHVTSDKKFKEVNVVITKGDDRTEKNVKAVSTHKVVESEKTGQIRESSTTSKIVHTTKTTSSTGSHTDNKEHSQVKHHEEFGKKTGDQKETTKTVTVQHGEHGSKNQKGEHVKTQVNSKDINTVKVSGNERTEKHENINNRKEVIQSGSSGNVKETSKSSKSAHTSTTTSEGSQNDRRDNVHSSYGQDKKTVQSSTHKQATVIGTQKNGEINKNHEKSSSKQEFTKSDTGNGKEITKTVTRVHTTQTTTNAESGGGSTSHSKHVQNESGKQNSHHQKGSKWTEVTVLGKTHSNDHGGHQGHHGHGKEEHGKTHSSGHRGSGHHGHGTHESSEDASRKNTKGTERFSKHEKSSSKHERVGSENGEFDESWTRTEDVQQSSSSDGNEERTVVQDTMTESERSHGMSGMSRSQQDESEKSESSNFSESSVSESSSSSSSSGGSSFSSFSKSSETYESSSGDKSRGSGQAHGLNKHAHSDYRKRKGHTDNEW